MSSLPLAFPSSLYQCASAWSISDVSHFILHSKTHGNVNTVYKISRRHISADASSSSSSSSFDTDFLFLRITPVQHRPFVEVKAEAEFMRYLEESLSLSSSSTALQLVKLMKTKTGELVLPIIDDAKEADGNEGKRGFIATAILMTGAPGRPADRSRDFIPSVMLAWSRLIAELHHFSSMLPVKSSSSSSSSSSTTTTTTTTTTSSSSSSSSSLSLLPTLSSKPTQLNDVPASLTAPRRQMWYDDSVLKIALSSLPSTASNVHNTTDSNCKTEVDSQDDTFHADSTIISFQRELSSLVSSMRAIAITADSLNFGLTHADLQMTNFFVTRNDSNDENDDSDASICAFDFDDSCYHYFVHDVAVAVCQIRRTCLGQLIKIEEEEAKQAEEGEEKQKRKSEKVQSIKDKFRLLEEIFLKSYNDRRNELLSSTPLSSSSSSSLSSLSSSSSSSRVFASPAELSLFVRYRALLILCWSSSLGLKNEKNVFDNDVQRQWYQDTQKVYRRMLTGE